MDKIDFKDLMQKAKAGADDGIKRAGKVAQKAAAGVNEGLDSAKETIRKTSISKDAVKALQNAIKDLEKDNKAKVHGDVQEETNAIIEQLKGLLQAVKNDPENCVEAVETLANEYRVKIGAMVESNQEEVDQIKFQVMPKRYDDALKACLNAKAAIETELEAIAKEKAESEGPTIVELKGSGIRLLVPNGYQKAQYTNPLKEIKKNITNGEEILRKYTSRSENIVVFRKLPPEKAIPYDGTEKLIEAIRNHLNDNQGIIEVNAGTSKRGYKYIYSIVKTIRDDFKGALYYLKMYIGNEESIVDIDATFSEENLTGERDSFGYALARNAGLVTNENDVMVGWNEDPYDPEYTKGITMNLSERSGLDAWFPDHPLSQARELVTALTEDKFMIEKPESDSADNQEDESEDSSPIIMEEYKENENQFYMDLFAKEPVLERHTIEINVE